MNVLLILVALFSSAGLWVLFVGGLLLRSDVYRFAASSRGIQYPPSRILADLGAVQRLVLDFVAESAPSGRFLEVLGEHNGRVRIGKLLQQRASAAAADDRGHSRFSFEETWTALFIMGVAGLLRFGRHCVTLTPSGREVLRRLNKTPASEAVESIMPPELQVAAAIDNRPLLEAAPHDNSGRSHVRRVTDALRDDASIALPDRARAIRGFQIGQLRTRTLGPSDSVESAGHHNRSVSCEQKRSAGVTVTAADHNELSAAIAAARKLAAPEGGMRLLLEELTHATIVSPGGLPPDVITMNSRARLVDIETNERLDLILVYPVEANFAEGRVSVFHPLGAAMFGRRVGEEIEWPVPYGFRRFEIKSVRFQPEAALALAA